MRITLDGLPLDTDQLTFACVLETAIERARAAGRVVIEVMIDGEPATDDQLAEPSRHEAPGAEIAMVTAEPIALVRTTLMEAADALSTAIELQRSSAARLHAGHSSEALESIGEALQIWHSIQQVVQQTTGMIGVTPDEITLEPTGAPQVSLGARITALGAALLELRDAVQAEDLSRLADALEFDLVEQAELWRALLERFSDRLREGLAP